MSRKHQSAARRRRMEAALRETASLTPAAVTAPAMTERRATLGLLESATVSDGRIENPDAVLKSFGSWEGLAFYARMARQYPFLVGICMQWISRINAIDRAVKPGDANDPTSVEMARDVRKLYARIRGKEILNQKFLWGRYYGIAPAEQVWSKDDRTGLLAPLDIYDLPPWAFKFGPDGEVYLLTAKSPTKGELQADADRKFLFFRWGSLYTPYGEGDFRYAYLPTWYIQQVLRFGLQAIERYGRPIPWYRYWRNRPTEEVTAIKASLKAQFGFYAATPQEAQQESLEFPALSVVANGTAGRAEIEFVRFMEGWCYVALLGTQQTQDKVGGSRALEDTRREISNDQTPPGSQALDALWTKWADQIGEVNWPNQPRELWPVFESDDDSDNTNINLSAVTDLGRALVAKYLPAAWVEHELVLAGASEQRAHEMVNSITTATDLSVMEPPASFLPANDPQDGNDMPSEENAPNASL